MLARVLPSSDLFYSKHDTMGVPLQVGTGAVQNVRSEMDFTSWQPASEEDMSAWFLGRGGGVRQREGHEELAALVIPAPPTGSRQSYY